MKRGFYTIMTAQFFSSLADNALFVAAIELLRTRGAPEWQSAALVPLFALFYVALAPFVGAFADAARARGGWHLEFHGFAGVGELARQTGELLNGRGISTDAWPQQVAFNILSSDTALDGNGTGTRERRVRQVLAAVLPQARIHLRQLVVPVFYGATISLHWQHEAAVERAAVAAALARVPGVRVHDGGDPAELPTPVGLGVDNEDINVSRLGTDAGDGLALLLADPLRAGLVRPLLAALLNEG